MSDRRVVLDEEEEGARAAVAADRGAPLGLGRGGPRVYRFRLRQVLAVTGLSEAALWKALGRAGVKLDDFEALIGWLVARARRGWEREQRARLRSGQKHRAVQKFSERGGA